MTDTTQDTVPRLSQRGRPSKVIQRDLSIARVLAKRERSKHEVMAELDLEWRVTYNSLCRLRELGLVELNRNGTRTPTWRVTVKGHEWLSTTTVTEGPTTEPTPEVPTPPEPAPVAEVPAPPEPEPGAQPVPIAPPPPEPDPQGVAPSPGPAEPVWPI